MAIADKVIETGVDNGHYAGIFRFLPDAVTLTRASDGSLLDVNEAFETLTGYRRVEVVGCKSAHLGYWLDPDQWREVSGLLKTSGEVRDLETRILCKDGTLLSVLMTLRSLEIEREQCYLSVVRNNPGLKLAQEKGRAQEVLLRDRLDTLLSSEDDISSEDVRQIIDFQQIQELMNSFYKVTGIGIAIVDLKGNILVATGWQDICSKFHRMHPQTFANCIESDTYLSQGLEEEEYKIYKCRNNMWDIATPIIVAGKQIANLFLGQFFFDDEVPDREIFALQAEAYGFEKEEYLAALERIPRWSRETVRNVMEFYSHFAHLVAELSYTNIGLAAALDERKQAENALSESERLLESEKRFRLLFEHMLDGVAYCRMLYDENGSPADFVYLDVNNSFLVSTGLHDVIGKKVSELLPGIKEYSPELFELYGRVASTGRPEKCEIYLEQLSIWRSMSVYSTEKGYFVSVSENITERKRIEAELGESHHKLRELTAHLNLTRERERQAFARKVHDELGTSLTLLKFDLAWLKRNYPPAEKAVAERIRAMDELIHECTITIQRITSELRPSLLDEQGLAAAIEWQAIDFERRSGISCGLEIDAAIPPLSQDKAIIAFRIFQESLSNVMRHSGATGVIVSLLDSGKRIVLRIADNGQGINAREISAATSFGILGMEERARLCDGTFTIKGIPGKGTTILLSIPV